MLVEFRQAPIRTKTQDRGDGIYCYYYSSTPVVLDYMYQYCSNGTCISTSHEDMSCKLVYNLEDPLSKYASLSKVPLETPTKKRPNKYSEYEY